MIDNELKGQIRRMLDSDMSFAVFRLPGEKPVLLHDNLSKSFEVVNWPGCEKPKAEIPTQISEDEYREALNTLIGSLNKRGGGKTVLSRVINIDSPDIDWAEVADQLWTAFPNAYGYIFYTPSTGAWVGASPETLLKIFPDGRFETQALAGTIPIEEDWDDKNREEQQIVVDYIESLLKETRIEYQKSRTESLTYGTIKHLSTVFTGKLPENFNRKDFLNKLAPTPALSGYPKAVAMDDIANLEKHQRNCYGGYISVLTDKGYYSFVTIRCAHFDVHTGRVAIYVGGGITPLSVVNDEDIETRRKAAGLLDIISSCTSKKQEILNK